MFRAAVEISWKKRHVRRAERATTRCRKIDDVWPCSTCIGGGTADLVDLPDTIQAALSLT